MLFGHKKLTRDYEIRFLPGKRKPRQLPKRLTIKISLFERIRIKRDTHSYLKHAAVIGEIISSYFSVFAKCLWFVPIISIPIYAADFWAFIDAPWLTGGLTPVYTGFFVTFGFAFLLIKFDSATRKKYAHKGDKREGSDTLSLTFAQAERVTPAVEAILRRQIPAKSVEQLATIGMDKHKPVRLVRNVLPVSPFFFRRPRQHHWPPLPEIGNRYKHYREIVDVVDAISAGLLGMVGAKPQLRYAEETNVPLAKDRYWRCDSQEMTDELTPDIFLRFHQSTVEQDFPPTGKTGDIATYVAYAVMGNFRQSPVYLLFVKDVLAILRGEHKEIPRQYQELVYRQLSVSPDEAVELLAVGKFSKFSARADRFNLEASSMPSPKPILSFANGDEDDPTMSFDPGRVWPSTEASAQTLHAIIALRRSIALAGKYLAYEVTPKRRDVLIIDNQRVMVARREDSPNSIFSIGAIWADNWAAFFPELKGRWMRQIAGYYCSDRAGSRTAGTSVSEGTDGPINVAPLPKSPEQPDETGKDEST